MRKGVTHHEIEAVVVAASKRGLQTVVGRPVKIREVVDQCKVGELAIQCEGPSHCLSVSVCRACEDCRGGPSGAGGWLIEIDHARELHSVIANVGDVETELAGESMLNTQR